MDNKRVHPTLSVGGVEPSTKFSDWWDRGGRDTTLLFRETLVGMKGSAF